MELSGGQSTLRPWTWGACPWGGWVEGLLGSFGILRIIKKTPLFQIIQQNWKDPKIFSVFLPKSMLCGSLKRILMSSLTDGKPKVEQKFGCWAYSPTGEPSIRTVVFLMLALAEKANLLLVELSTLLFKWNNVHVLPQAGSYLNLDE